MVVFEEMRAAIEAAAPDKLDTVASAIAQAYGVGGLTDEQYEQLDELLAAWRRVAQAAPARMQTLATACVQLVPAARITALDRAHVALRAPPGAGAGLLLDTCLPGSPRHSPLASRRCWQ